jgi:hypothetical protein
MILDGFDVPTDVSLVLAIDSIGDTEGALPGGSNESETFARFLDRRPSYMEMMAYPLSRAMELTVGMILMDVAA